jgi:putative ABC transport system permease protein
MLKKSTLREIKGSLGRYLAILAIVALGVGFFSGLKVTREAMIITTSDYLAESQFFDYQVVSTLGFEDEDVEALSQEDHVAVAAGSISTDVLYRAEGEDVDKVLKLHSVTDGVNTLELKSGRLPQGEDECVVDYRLFSDDPVGKTITISEDNDEDTLDMLKTRTLTITGTVVSPYYLNFERGSTSLGNGTVAGFAYVSREAFDVDYYTEIFLRLDQNYQIYSDEYDDLIDATEDNIQAAVEERADIRYRKIVEDAEEELADGQKEYDENYAEYLTSKADAEAQLADSWQEIQDGQAEIAKNRKDLDQQEKELQASKTQVETGLAQLSDQRAQF